MTYNGNGTTNETTQQISSTMCFGKCNTDIANLTQGTFNYFYTRDNKQNFEIHFLCSKCMDQVQELEGHDREAIHKIYGIDKNIIWQTITKKEIDEGLLKGEIKNEQQEVQDWCQDCSQLQNVLSQFDISIKRLTANSNNNSLKQYVATYYAKEQYNKDIKLFEDLKNRLRSEKNHTKRILIKNKIDEIYAKYQQNQNII